MRGAGVGEGMTLTRRTFLGAFAAAVFVTVAPWFGVNDVESYSALIEEDLRRAYEPAITAQLNQESIILQMLERREGMFA